MKKTTRFIIYNVIALICVIFLITIRKLLFVSPVFFIRFETYSQMGNLFTSMILFALFFSLIVLMLNLSLFLETKYRPLILIIPVFSLVLLYKSLIGISFAVGLFIATLFILYLPPKMLIQDYKTFLSAMQMYNKSVIWKTFWFMFLFLFIISILTNVNYTDPLFDNIHNIMINLMGGDTTKEFLVNLIAEQTGAKISADQIPEPLLNASLESAKDFSSGVLMQAKSIITSFPGANMLIALFVVVIISGIFSIPFFISQLLTFLILLIFGNLFKYEEYINVEKKPDHSEQSSEQKSEENNDSNINPPENLNSLEQNINQNLEVPQQFNNNT